MPAWPRRCLVKLQQEGDGHGGGREGDDNAGDDQRLRHRICLKSGRRAPAGNDAEQQEYAAADDVEGQDLAQRLRVGDKAEQAKTNQTAPQSKQRHLVMAAPSVLGSRRQQTERDADRERQAGLGER